MTALNALQLPLARCAAPCGPVASGLPGYRRRGAQHLEPNVLLPLAGPRGVQSEQEDYRRAANGLHRDTIFAGHRAGDWVSLLRPSLAGEASIPLTVCCSRARPRRIRRTEWSAAVRQGRGAAPQLQDCGRSGARNRGRAEYLRRRSTPGLVYTVQFSDDLATWTNSSAAGTVTTIDATWERVVVADSSVGAPRRFARVLVNWSN